MAKSEGAQAPSPAAAPTQSEPQSQIERLSSRLPGGQTEWPTQYDGIPYASIIESWLQAKGIYGGVAQGNRNNMFYQLALDLRYICDFKKDWLLQVMPDWDMPQAEREQTIQSALSRAQGRQLPLDLTTAIDRVRGLEGLADLDETAVSSELRNPLPKRLPLVFRLISRLYPNNPHAMLLCSLPALGALCSNVRATYMDGWSTSEPIFLCILSAPQASGKRIAKSLNDILTAPIRRHDDEERQKLLDYVQEKERKKNEKKQPIKPETHIRMVSVKISPRQLVETLHKAEGKSLYTFCEELDTVTKSNKAGAWADKGDIMRLAFDGGEYGQDYANDNAYNVIVQVRWCMLFCGTPGAVNRFFGNVEDGLFTRFVIANLEANRGSKLKKAKAPDARLMGQLSAEVERLYEVGSGESVLTIELPRTEKALRAWEDMQIAVWRAGGKKDYALDILRRRSMAMGFRAAQIAFATEGMRETLSVPDFAVWVAQEVLDQQMALYGKELNEVGRTERTMISQANERIRSNSTLNLFAQLPDKFTMKDVDDLRAMKGLTSPSTKTVSRWMEQGMVEARQIGSSRSKVYTKTEEYRNEAPRQVEESDTPQLFDEDEPPRDEDEDGQETNFPVSEFTQ